MSIQHILVDKIKQIARMLRRFLYGYFRNRGGKVLVYHKVSSKSSIFTDMLNITISPRVFEDQMLAIVKKYKPVSFTEFCNNPLASNKITITFDDGYECFKEEALPILEKLQIPATLFINPSTLKSGVGWLNKLSLLLQRMDLLEKQNLLLAAAGVSEQKPEAYHFCYNFVPFQTENTIDYYFEKYAQDIDIDSLYLSVEDVLELSQHPLLEIGSHSMNHLPLDRLDDDTLFYEIVSGHRELQKLLNLELSYMALPFGFKKYKSERLLKNVSEITNYFVTAYGGSQHIVLPNGLREIQRTTAPVSCQTSREFMRFLHTN